MKHILYSYPTTATPTRNTFISLLLSAHDCGKNDISEDGTFVVGPDHDVEVRFAQFHWNKTKDIFISKIKYIKNIHI